MTDKNKIIRDKDGIIENHYDNIEINKMTGLRKDIMKFVNDEEIADMSDTFSAMVLKGYWSGAVQEMLLYMIKNKWLYHYVKRSQDGEGSNELLTFEQPYYRLAMMNRLQKEYEDERGIVEIKI